MTNAEACRRYRAKMKNNPEWVEKIRLQTQKRQEFKRFGRPRIEILEYFNFTCQKCFVIYKDNPERFDVDHIDNNGRNTTNPNNDFSNFQLLCSSCHAKKTWFKRHSEIKAKGVFVNHWKNIYGKKKTPPKKDPITGKFVSSH